MNRRNIFIVLTLIFLTLITILVIAVARGYQIDIKNRKVSPTGILVATSDPDGAQVLVDGKLVTATNNTINLAPGKYVVKIIKDGFNPWEKKVEIKAEEVVKTNTFLFPNLPDLRPLTLNGAKNPTLSPDGRKIAYTVASSSAEKNGLWILDMTRSFPFSTADFRQISKEILPQISWTVDSKEIIATSSGRTYLLESDRLNDTLSPITQIPIVIPKINPILPLILATTSGKIQFSPDENMVFYQATASANFMPAVYLPGTNPTPESRSLKVGNYYVYDLKEDKNYQINDCPNCVWFPTSRHLLSNSSKEISVMEYDGSNKSVIYAGPFKPEVVFPWPDGHKIVILTTLNGTTENLYTINLR